MFSIIASLGITVMMVGIHMIKKEMNQLKFNIYIQLVGIMVIQILSLVNIIMIIVNLYIKTYGLFNNLLLLIQALKATIEIEN